MNSKLWFVYCLKSLSSSKTYVGATVNLSRRLRQHCGELKGGARYTSSGRPWSYVFIVSGFPEKRTALSFEWHWKHAKVRGKRGIDRREQQLEKVLNSPKFVNVARNLIVNKFLYEK